MHVRRARPVIAASAVLIAASACAGAPEAAGGSTETQAGDQANYPVEVENCGQTVVLKERPQRAVTLNQGATEVALALGAEDQLAGTAYLDDEVATHWAEAYETVPVLAEQYPARETFLAAQPDFAYASYSSAFAPQAVGTREELSKGAIATYLSPFYCEGAERPKASFEAVWDEVSDVAQIFGVSDKADSLITSQRSQLAALADEAEGAGVTVLWFDSGDKTPLVGGGGGGPQVVMEAVGATNAFADLENGWAEVSWERVLEADPDVIVLADASWSTAEEKRAYLENDPVTSQLRAVRSQAFVVVPYSESTPGVRLVDGAQGLAQGLADVKAQ